MNPRSLPRASLFLVLLALPGCTLSPSAAPAAAPARPPAAVTVTAPIREFLVEWDRFTGRVQPVETVEVRARIDGYLEATHFQEGSVVEAGDLLFSLDRRPLEADLRRAEAAVAEAKASQARATGSLAQAAARRRQAGSERSLAASRLARAERAAAGNSIAAEEVEVRRSEAQQAGASVAAADAAVAVAEAEVSLADAAVATAEAGLVRVQLELDYTRITAPISGRISRREITAGNLVKGGSDGTLLTTLVSLDPIHVYIDANERDFLRYHRLDQAGKRQSSRYARNPVYLALADEVGFPHLGYMDFVENRMNQGTGTIRGRALFANPGHDLFPGLFASVRIPGSARYEAVLIPDSAIGTDQARRFVLVVDAEQTVRSQEVTLGPLAKGLRVIRAGLDGSERVILRGIQRVRPGSKVTPTFEETVPRPQPDDLPDDYTPLATPPKPRVETAPSSATGEASR